MTRRGFYVCLILFVICLASRAQNQSLLDARKALSDKDYPRSLNLLLSAAEEANLTEQTKLKIETQYLLGIVYKQLKRPQQALVALLTAQYYAAAFPEFHIPIDLELATLYEDIGAYAQSSQYYRKLYKRAGTAQERALYLEKSGNNSWHLSRPDSSLYYYQSALALIPQDSIVSRYRLLKAISECYIVKEEYEHALAVEKSVLPLAGLHKSTSSKEDVWNTIGYLHNHLQHYEDALISFKNAKSSGNYSSYIHELNIGSMYLKLKKADSSITYFKNALALVTSKHDEENEALINNYLATSYVSEKELSKASLCNDKAIVLALKKNNPHLLSDGYLIKSRISAAGGKKTESQHYVQLYRKIQDSLTLAEHIAKLEKKKYVPEVQQKEEEIRQLILNNEIEILKNLRNNEARQKEINDQAMQLTLFDIQLSNEKLIREKAISELINKKRQLEIQQLNQIRNEEKLTAQVTQGKLEITRYKLDQLESEHEKKTLQVEKQLLMLEKSKQTQTFLWIALLLISLLMGLLFLFYKLRAKAKAHALQLVNLDIQQRMLRSQMNPHFLFNSLSSIQGFIASNEKRNADKFLARYASLMRLILEHTSKEIISLDDEIKALKNYLELEQMRYNNSFDYSIQCDSDIEAEHTGIPPMLIQPYVENAIVHGLRHKTEKGYLTVFFEREKEYIRCNIEDNGIGRTAAEEINRRREKKHRSRAHDLSMDRIQLMNKKLKSSMEISFQDLTHADGRAAGTRVIIKIKSEELL
ncbi:MAG: histidine kinase [Cytophagaceae bacterium]|nr:histidine kinase [Cytophagaceae bacterium]